MNNANGMGSDLKNDDTVISNDEDNDDIDAASRGDEFGLLDSVTNNDLVINDKDNDVGTTVTRFDIFSRLYDWSKHFPKVDNFQKDHTLLLSRN